MEKINQIKKWWPFVAVGVVLLVVLGMNRFSKEELLWEDVSDTTVVMSSEESVNQVVIDIKGAVKKPGVYELDSGARMKDAIFLAGGLTAKAEERQLNLAEQLRDQQMIYVPTVDEVSEESIVISESTQANNDAKININTADSTELQQLSGIGAAKAQAIVDYREEHGNFQSVESLQEVSGIGEKTVERLKDKLSI